MMAKPEMIRNHPSRLVERLPNGLWGINSETMISVPTKKVMSNGICLLMCPLYVLVCCQKVFEEMYAKNFEHYTNKKGYDDYCFSHILPLQTSKLIGFI